MFIATSVLSFPVLLVNLMREYAERISLSYK